MDTTDNQVTQDLIRLSQFGKALADSSGCTVAKAAVPAELKSLGNFSTAVIQAFVYLNREIPDPGCALKEFNVQVSSVAVSPVLSFPGEPL